MAEQTNADQIQNGKDLYMVVAEELLHDQPKGVCLLLMTGVDFENISNMDHYIENNDEGSSSLALGNAIAMVRVARIKDMNKFRGVVEQARDDSGALTQRFIEETDPARLRQGWNNHGGLWVWKVLTELGGAEDCGDIVEEEKLVPATVLQQIGRFVLQIMVDGKYIPARADYQVHTLDLLDAKEKHAITDEEN